jgi:hypothetical protein
MAIREQVSGPGSASQRTDLNVSAQPTRYMAGGSYGEGQELMGLQQGAPMAAGPNLSVNPSDIRRSTVAPIVPLTAPSQRPNEPLTAGVDFGAGPGSEVLNLPQSQEKTLINVVEELIPHDTTGEISAIYNFLRDRGF